MAAGAADETQVRPAEGTPAPRLLDRARVALELGVRRAVVERIFRSLPTVRPPGVRCEYVRREHLDDLIERWTVVDK